MHCITGTSEFFDEANGITANYTIGVRKGRDYFKGEIKQNGRVVSVLTGTYMGYIEFDGVRYWDIRKMQNFDLVEPALKKVLDSDWRKRTDTQSKLAGDNV